MERCMNGIRGVRRPYSPLRVLCAHTTSWYIAHRFRSLLSLLVDCLVSLSMVDVVRESRYVVPLLYILFFPSAFLFLPLPVSAHAANPNCAAIPGAVRPRRNRCFYPIPDICARRLDIVHEKATRGQRARRASVVVGQTPICATDSYARRTDSGPTILESPITHGIEQQPTQLHAATVSQCHC